jgi:class 3 adenylate cyclase/tetratricopeptide (TPR) repeat protein
MSTAPLHCPSCGYESAAAARYCAQCGEPQPPRCPACASAIGLGQRFCPACGHGLAALKVAPPAAAPLEGGADRRPVTIVFSDLSGFTSLTERLDPEEVEAAMRRIREAATMFVEGHGGVVNQFVGDEVMALFGAGRAHRDDPSRALRATLALHEAVRAIGIELEARLGRRLLLHSGVNTGLAVVRASGAQAGRYAVTGDAVNLCARLRNAAREDQIVVGDETWRLAGAQWSGEALEPLQVKGKEHPVVAWRLLGASGVVALRPVVGRDDELAQFEVVARACAQRGRARLVVVRGEPGIGKTRLLQEFAQVASSHGYATHAACVFDFGPSRGRQAMRSLIESLLGVPPAAASGDRRAAVQRFAAQAEVPDLVIPFLLDALGAELDTPSRSIYTAMDERMRAARTHDAIAALIARAAADAPLFIALEDVHWCEAPEVDRLVALVAASAGRPVLFALSSRVDTDPLDVARRAAMREVPALTIDLGPLDSDSARALADQFSAVSTALVASCLERASGNPLFIEQLLLSAVDTLHLALPGSVQAVVIARLDQLEPSSRSAAQAAAVLGLRFEQAALCHLIEQPSCDCRVLLDHGILRRDGADLAFSHALVRDGAYESLLKARRRELHLRAAQWFSERDAGLRAEHLALAGSADAAAGFLRAAQLEASAFRLERCLTLAERGLALDGDVAARHGLLCLEGQTLLDMGRGADARRAFGRALDASRGPAERCTALIGLAGAMRLTDEIDAALATLDEAQALAGDDALLRERSRLHHLRGNLYFPLGRLDGCEREHRQALECAQRAGSRADEAAALGGLGDAYYLQGRMQTAAEHFERCVTLSREIGLGRAEVANAPMISFCSLVAGDVRRAIDTAHAALELAERCGLPRAAGIAIHALTYTNMCYVEDLDEASRWALRAVELARGLGMRRFEGEGLGFQSHVELRRGRRQNALALAGEALQIARATGMRYLGPTALVDLALATDDAGERAAALAEAEALLAQGCASHNHFWFYQHAIDLALEAADWPGVERLVAAFEGYTRAERPRSSALLIRRGRALARFGQGQRDAELHDELRWLRQQLLGVPLRAALHAVERALAELGAAVDGGGSKRGQTAR